MFLYPSRTSGASIPKRSRNSSNVLFVGYPAQLILIASSTPCNSTSKVDVIGWTYFSKKTNGYITIMRWKEKSDTPHISTGLGHWSSQIFQAAKLCLASHIWCNVVLLCSMSPSEIVIVAVWQEWIQKQCKGWEFPETDGMLYVENKLFFTLNRVPMEENFDCFDVSSGNGGKRLATNEHLEAYKRAWCSATT